MVGKILFASGPKGYCFIEPEQGGQDLFAHAVNFLDASIEFENRVLQGRKVRFDKIKTQKGAAAVRVEVID